MELESPYLKAIQEIPGSTPGLKYKNLNSMAWSIVSSTKIHGDSTLCISINDVPEPLIPLVKVEVAKSLRQCEVVADALKSDDCEIVDRALRIDWFFRADNTKIMNIDYFDKNIFPHVSLNTRLKLIKKIAASLRACADTVLAENFYSQIINKYGEKQAEPMLVACGESFVWKIVVERKIVLSCRLVKNLFIRYPELVIRYLKLSKRSEDETSRNLHDVRIHKYSDFLPRLIKNHMKSLIELIEMHDETLGIKLSNKATERFLKSNVEVVLNRPTLYVQMMSLKVIAAKLTKSQYKRMFGRLYPPKMKDFTWGSIKNYLQYYPEQERVALVLETYRNAYNSELLDNNDVINEELIGMLPTEERAKQARLKLVKEPDWHDSRWRIERMWRCYLPIEESIPSIKTEISKTSSVDDRSLLLQQMFFTCKINDDKDALLEALRYFTTRHRNEQTNLIFGVLQSIVQYIDLSTLEKEHWTIINDFLRFLQVKNELVQHTTTSRQILTASIHFNIIHDIPYDEAIGIMVEILIRGWNQSWSILEKYPEHDRTCFSMMMQILPKIYPNDHNIWNNHRLDAINDIVKTIQNFNNRNAKAKIERLSIIDYAWLLEAVKKIVEAPPKDRQWKVEGIVNYLKTQEPELYEKWITVDENAVGDVKTDEARKILKKEPLKVLKNCENYLKELKTCVTYNSWAQRFVKSCRWYQDIPIIFATRCLKDVVNDTDENSLIILGILMDGSTFSRVIEPLVPKASAIDTTSENAKETYKVIYAIPRAMNLVNPPVSLNLVLNFCQGEYLSLGLVSLTNICRRISVDRIEKFTRELSDLRVSVKKHGIRLFCMVASINDYHEFLSNLWKTEKHRSIRAVVFEKIRNLFLDNSCDETWKIMSDCMSDLGEDDDDCLREIVTFSNVPDVYVADYVMKLFESLEKLSHDFSSPRVIAYLSRLLNSIDSPTSRLLTEEFSSTLLKRYFCNVDLPIVLREPGMHYAVDGYLRAVEERIDQRLDVFSTHYVNLLKKYWNIRDRKVTTHCPINWMTHEFVNNVVFHYGADDINVRIMQTILDAFNAVLKPQQDWMTYAILKVGVGLRKNDSPSDISRKFFDLLPHLVETLSPMMIAEIAEIVDQWIGKLVEGDSSEIAKFDVIEKLCRTNDAYALIIAAKLLFRSNNRELEDRHNKIVELLQNSQNPAVLSIVYQHVNTCDITD